MPNPSASKKVARAASTGGGRTSRGKTPVAWYGSLALLVLLGTAAVVQSRADLADRKGEADQTEPTVNDHWHAAYGIYVCGEFLPALSDDRDPRGIHTHKLESGQGDGVIHIHPFTSRAAGKNATLGVFADAIRLEMSSTRLEVPGGETYEDGDKCKTGEHKGKEIDVRLVVDGEEYEGNPLEFNFERDRQQVVLVAAPEDIDVPAPPSVPQLDNLTDVGPQPGAPGAPGAQPTEGGTETSAPDGSTAPPEGDGSAPAGDPTATSAPADGGTTETTAAP